MVFAEAVENDVTYLNLWSRWKSCVMCKVTIIFSFGVQLPLWEAQNLFGAYGSCKDVGTTETKGKETKRHLDHWTLLALHQG